MPDKPLARCPSTKVGQPWLLWLRGLSAVLRTERALVQLPVVFPEFQAWFPHPIPAVRAQARGS